MNTQTLVRLANPDAVVASRLTGFSFPSLVVLDFDSFGQVQILTPDLLLNFRLIHLIVATHLPFFLFCCFIFRGIQKSGPCTSYLLSLNLQKPLRSRRLSPTMADNEDLTQVAESAEVDAEMEGAEEAQEILEEDGAAEQAGAGPEPNGAPKPNPQTVFIEYLKSPIVRLVVGTEETKRR